MNREKQLTHDIAAHGTLLRRAIEAGDTYHIEVAAESIVRDSKRLEELKAYKATLPDSVLSGKKI